MLNIYIYMYVDPRKRSRNIIAGTAFAWLVSVKNVKTYSLAVTYSIEFFSSLVFDLKS